MKDMFKMDIENSVEGWKIFGNTVLKQAQYRHQPLKAVVNINGTLDSKQMSALQYALMEFDRIERNLNRLVEKKLEIHVNNVGDAYRIHHYFWVITRTRVLLDVIIFCEEKQILDPGSMLAAEDDQEKESSDEDASENNLRISLGRIFPLVCVGQKVQNQSVAPYNKFLSAREPEVVKNHLQKLFDKDQNIILQKREKAPIPKKSSNISDGLETLESEAAMEDSDAALDFIEFYYQSILQKMFREISGKKGGQAMDSTQKTIIQQELKKILLAQMPSLHLLARMLWALSLWALVLTKDLFVYENGKWTLDMETLQCGRLDAISYADGLQQLIENAYIHSDMHRAYLSIRIHCTDIQSEGTQSLAENAANRRDLTNRIKTLTSGSSKSNISSYKLDSNAKYYFEFQVVNDSVSFKGTRENFVGCAPRGIAEKYFENIGRPWPPTEPYTLQQIFRGDLLPQKLREDPKHLSQHYGLRIFEKTVRVNGGFFYVSSPGLDGRKPVLNRYQAFGKEESSLQDENLEPHTAYFILLPITPHWRDMIGENDYSQEQALFETSALREPYKQRILRLQQGHGVEQFIFEEENLLQTPGEKLPRLSYNLPVNPAKKMEKVEELYDALVACLKGAGEKTVCLLDVMQVQDCILVELIAKMLFLFIAESHNIAGGKQPFLFALLLPTKEYIGEFIRIFTIFYDKLSNNKAMDRAQVALCIYSEEQKEFPVPEVAFLFAGNTSSSARITARTFAYYNTDVSMEMIPQIRYLTQESILEGKAIAQFPFDLILTAQSSDSPKETNQSWFLRRMDYYLQNDLWKRPLGCRIHGIKVRLKSNIFPEDFYEAELLFHNIGIIYRFAYLIVQDILRQWEILSKQQDTPLHLVLVGYENYSSVLVEQISALLNKEKNLTTLESVHYMIYSSKTEPGQMLQMSPELRALETTVRRDLLSQSAYLSVVPIGTTLSTIYHIQGEVNRYKSRQSLKLDDYVLILVVDAMQRGGGAPAAKRYWHFKRAAKSNLPGYVQLGRKVAHEPEKNARFFLAPTTNWKCAEDADGEEPLNESVLVYVDQTSTIPKDIFVGAKTNFRGISPFLKNKDENARRIELLKTCIYYGHMVTNNNHFQFYFDMDRFYAKITEPATNASGHTTKQNLIAWLQNCRKSIQPNAYNIIVSPLHQEDSPFAKAVVDHVFEHSLRFLHIDISDTLREDIRAKFSYIAEEYAKIKHFEREKIVNVYFVNTAITSGASLQRARNLIMMLLEESGMPYDRGNVFKGCFVMVNRSGFDTINAYIEGPLENFHAYVHLAVPSLNIRKNRCPTCELVERYKTIEQRCSSSQLGEEFHRLAEKHSQREVSQHVSWQRNLIMTRSGYASWLWQFLSSYVPNRRPSERQKTFHIGIFTVDRTEFIRMQKLRQLMAWGMKQTLRQWGIGAESARDAKKIRETEEEPFLKTLNAFTLQKLAQLIKQDTDEARKAIGGESTDEYLLQPEYWQHVVMDYVCGQKHYMRMASMHNTFLATEEMTTTIADKPIHERGVDTAEKLLGVISATLERADDPNLQVEWLISYLKVMSRPHLAQYHHIRQGILLIMLRIVDNAINEALYSDNLTLTGINDLFCYLQDDNHDVAPLVQYQLLQTCLKRLAGLQSTYLLRQENQNKILAKVDKLRKRYFMELNQSLTQKGARCLQLIQVFPTEESILITMVKNVKWASSYGEDEHGCYLIEKEFAEEDSHGRDDEIDKKMASSD